MVVLNAHTRRALLEIDAAVREMQESTKKKLLERMEGQDVRVDKCRQQVEHLQSRLRLQTTELKEQAAFLLKSNAEMASKVRKLQEKANQDKHERNEEKEWIVSIWPDHVVLPTLLKSFAAQLESTRVDAKLELVRELSGDAPERKRLELLMNKRAARDRVIFRIEQAGQWTVATTTTTDADGSTSQRVYYRNDTTGQSSWEPPAVMFYQPPAELWDSEKMDWKPSVPLDHFTSAEPPTGQLSVGLDPTNDPAKGTGGDANETPKKIRSDAASDLNDELDDPEEEDEDLGEDEEEAVEEANAVFCREQIEQANEKLRELQEEIEQTKTLQRSLTLQFLNATKESFEKEKQALQEEDEQNKQIERAKRQEQQIQAEAAKATAAAKANAATASSSRKTSNSPVHTTKSSPVGKKGLVLTKEEEAFEKELDNFVKAARADRKYLACPYAKDVRAREHLLQDAEFVHLRFVEEQVASLEKMEFDLLDKTSLRQEEAEKRIAFLESLLEEISQSQEHSEQELTSLRAQEQAAGSHANQPDDQARRAERIRFLTTSLGHLQVDLALYRTDLGFFKQLQQCEQQVHETVWKIQADSQVERVRFMVERACREENVLRLHDLSLKLQRDFDEAKALGQRASNPIEVVEFRNRSKSEVARVAKELNECRSKLEKELEAQQRLFALEKRLIDYEKQKLEHEIQLFDDKQTLWTKCFVRQEDMLQARKTLERLVLLSPREEENTLSQSTIQEDGSVSSRPKSFDELFQENAEIFDLKLKAVQQVRGFLLLCYDREQKWRQLASLTLVEATSSSEWMTLWQQQRHMEMVADLTSRYEHELMEVKKAKRLQEKVSEFLRDQLHQKQETFDQTLAKVQQNADLVQAHSNDIIKQLNQQIAKLEQKQKDIEEAHHKRLDAMVQRQDESRKLLEEQLHQEIHKQHDLTYFNTCLKRELRRQSQVSRHLLRNLRSLHKYHAMEINDLRFRVAAQIRKIQQLTLWNASLKMQLVKMAQKMVMFQKEMEKQLIKHKQQQRFLRVANWKQRIAMQMVLSDFDLLFEFFADGLEILSGSTAQQNTKLRVNGGIEVIAALMEHSHNVSIRQIASAALGKITWNENATHRMIGWLAKTKYIKWVKRMSATAMQILESKNKQFDDQRGIFALSPEEQEEWNLFADCTDPAEFDQEPTPGEGPPNQQAAKHKRLQLVTKWNTRKQTSVPNMNLENQEYIGLATHVLKALVNLCRGARVSLKLNCGSVAPSALEDRPSKPKGEESQEQWLVVQRNALVSLALVVMHTRNTYVVGRIEGCISILVQLLQCCVTRDTFATTFSPSDKLRDEITLYVIEALGNLAFQNEFNQQQIVRNGAIGLLVQLCRQHQQPNLHAGSTSNVDLLHTSLKALACCCTGNIEVCTEMNKHLALGTLVQLCHSNWIFDLVELDKFESIQEFASHCVLNMIGLLLPERDSNVLACFLDQEFEILQPNRAIAALAMDEEPTVEPENGPTKCQQTIADKIGCFVLMCASSNRQVARNGAMILGSFAFEDEVRNEVGNAGGIDALFLLAHSFDEEVQALATWALANLTWNRLNQYRVMRYFDQLYAFCAFDKHSSNYLHASKGVQQPPTEICNSWNHRQRRNETRQHALCVVANVLFFNEENRMLVGGNEQWMALFQQICDLAQESPSLSASTTSLQHEHRQEEQEQRKRELIGPLEQHHFAGKWLEHVARALCSISYSDHFALCENAMSAMQLFLRLCVHEPNLVVQRHGVFGLINMCLHDVNKTRMLELNGVEVLVKLSGADDVELRNAAIEALELLADSRSLKQDGATRALDETGGDLKKLLSLCDSSNSTIVAMATDAIADQVWQKSANKVKLRNEHGIDRLLRLCTESDDHPNVIVSSLWAIRNAVQENVRNQDLIHAFDGINALLHVYDRHKHQEEVVEALLAAFVAIVANHSTNSQQMIKNGLDVLIEIADADVSRAKHHTQCQSQGVESCQLPQLYSRMEDHQPEQGFSFSKKGGRRIENSALAADVLHLLAPFNALKVVGSSSPLSPSKKKLGPTRRSLERHQQHQQTTK